MSFSREPPPQPPPLIGEPTTGLAARMLPAGRPPTSAGFRCAHAHTSASLYMRASVHVRRHKHAPRIKVSSSKKIRLISDQEPSESCRGDDQHSIRSDLIRPDPIRSAATKELPLCGVVRGLKRLSCRLLMLDLILLCATAAAAAAAAKLFCHVVDAHTMTRHSSPVARSAGLSVGRSSCARAYMIS